MVAGHLQQKKGYWYMVLNLYDEQGRRKSKWIATHLPVQGNKHRAEEMLLQTRQQYADSRESSGLLFADYMLQWLEKMKPKVSPPPTMAISIILNGESVLTSVNEALRWPSCGPLIWSGTIRTSKPRAFRLIP